VITRKLRLKLMLHASLLGLFALERSALIMKIVLLPLESKPAASSLDEYYRKHGGRRKFI